MLIFLTEFLVCRTKQSFLPMFMIILYLEKKVKKTNKIESKIQSIVMTFGLFGFLVSGFFVS